MTSPANESERAVFNSSGASPIAGSWWSAFGARTACQPPPLLQRRTDMQTLDSLITAAVQLAGTEAVSHGARLWQSEGGRRCPLGWDGCSQAVYVDMKTGEYDYGEPGGPGHADCERTCQHGMQPCTEEEED